jgi:hypothetical protein
LEEYLGRPEYESIDPTKPILSQTTIFEMAGRTFVMPKVYIQSNLGGHLTIDGINLLYVLPDFKSRADFTSRQEYEKARSDRRLAHMLVEPAAMRPTMATMVENLRNSGLTKQEYVGVRDGLEYHKWYRGTAQQPILYYEIYLERDPSGNIISYIECDPKERGAHVLFPGCSHRFQDAGLLFKIYYNKANYFSSWREQRRRAIEFLRSFEITNNQQHRG